jgi:hypothetical protein
MAAHPGNYGPGVGVTRNEWQTECDYTPRTNGVDGWVAKVPAGNDGRTLTATGQGVEFDLDLYFYDENCALLGTADEAGTHQSGEIPEGTAYVMAASYAGSNLHVRFSVS